MSVYSGFATRQQESVYTRLIEKVLSLTIKKCLSLMFNEQINDEQWIQDLKKCYKHIKFLDGYKYLLPRFSQVIAPFVFFSCQKQGVLPSSTSSHISGMTAFKKQKAIIEHNENLTSSYNNFPTELSFNFDKTMSIHGFLNNQNHSQQQSLNQMSPRTQQLIEDGMNKQAKLKSESKQPSKKGLLTTNKIDVSPQNTSLQNTEVKLQEIQQKKHHKTRSQTDMSNGAQDVVRRIPFQNFQQNFQPADFKGSRVEDVRQSKSYLKPSVTPVRLQNNLRQNEETLSHRTDNFISPDATYMEQTFQHRYMPPRQPLNLSQLAIDQYGRIISVPMQARKTKKKKKKISKNYITPSQQFMMSQYPQLSQPARLNGHFTPLNLSGQISSRQKNLFNMDSARSNSSQNKSNNVNKKYVKNFYKLTNEKFINLKKLPLYQL
ncbi:UNKNOWN [Stylonychia lemnae]|uniref:Uncharacterized protein n=1 Tax=Stylonychia lemnae TaxID=5949 RepID=A0A078A9B0_STYLE|nr:UNKNOWN [Stylonychia lemnae]|eukprot:CDW78167.1 UNKNOWN [Stylonychia lemnae]